MAAAGTTASSCPIPGSQHPPIPEGYSSTPGGTVYCTTPGGTRIIYDRKFLLECKNSPVARTPPCCLPQIPGVTSLAQSSLVKLEELKEQNESKEAMPDQDQFEMDI
ncbi:eukaryotic translation initiation factor 4E-binding protein 3 [Apus apus]|uniref:eukaryotic translation initiation factor 4E-binding protein 3 n=1 Tax=Apus apus TaxID=8895 RepID=UPI0021F886C5|nr:eukaryotic translation initiation factor 4E-binding protein 3 [Apus apus]